MAAEKLTEVPLESIRLLETKGRTAAAEPITTFIQVAFEVVVLVNAGTFVLKTIRSLEHSFPGPFVPENE